MNKKKRKALKQLKLERNEFHARLERIYQWNVDVLSGHSAFISAELRAMILDEPRKIGFRVNEE